MEIRRHLSDAWRAIERNPGYAAAFTLTLGLAVGVNSAVFSVVNAVLLKPLPFADADRIAYLQQPVTRAGVANTNFSFQEVADYRAGVASFDQVVEFGDWTFSVVPGGDAEPHRAVGGLVTSNYFEVMGMGATLGRVLTPDDGTDGAEPVMVLTNEYWTRAFGADPGVLDELVELNGRRTRIVGVLGPGAHYTGSRRQDFYVNYATNDHYLGASMQDERTHRMTDVFARLRPGATLEGARAEVEALAGELHGEYPDAYPANLGFEISLTRWQDELTKDARPIFLLLMGTVALVLLLACANLANLTLTRLIRREGDLATRAALGATPGSLRTGLVVENLVLSLGGALLGVGLAYVSRQALSSYAARFTVRAEEVGVDGTVFAATLLAGVAVAVLLAFLPGMPVTPRVGLAAAGGRSIGGRARRRVQRGLVVAQLSLSFALLAGAGLLVRSLLALEAVDPGFSTENVLTLQAFQSFATSGPTLTNAEVFRQVEHQVMAFPGVRAVGVADFAPLTAGGDPISWNLRVQGGGEGSERSSQMAHNRVTPGYFEALGIRLLAGRTLTHQDMAETDSVVVVNQAFAREWFGDTDPVGRYIQWSFSGQNWTPLHRVVGVVADGRQFGLQREPIPTIYQAAEQAGYGFTMVVATTGDPAPLTQAVRDAIHQVDPTRPVDQVRTVDDLLEEDVAPARLNATLFGTFALLALAIAAVGVLGVLAFSVSQRTREFGLRMAVGADQGQVLRTVLGEGATLVVVALLLGGTAAALGARLLSGLLYGIEPLDAPTFVAAAVALGGTALVAAFLPARRATRVDPVRALRSD